MKRPTRLVPDLTKIGQRIWRLLAYEKQNTKQKHRSPKRVLRLPDLDFAKTAVLNTLSSSDSRRSYRFAIDDFVTWYCSEPRLAFSKTVVLRYRLELESRHLAPSTINLRLAAKKLGVRLGNWLGRIAHGDSRGDGCK